VALQVDRRGAHDAAVARQAHRHEFRVEHAADADSEVEALAHEIDHAIGEIERDIDLGMGGKKAGRMGRHMAPAESSGRGQAQMARRGVAPGADQVLGTVYLREGALALLDIDGALLGHRQMPRGAVQQLDAEAPLQCIDAAPEHGRGNADAASGLGEASGLDGRDEGLHLFQAIHGTFCCGAGY
jgi:hypothetical protein